MATEKEIRTIQAANYHQLLTIKRLNKQAGVKVIGLNNAISLAKSIMNEPDIAWVEKQIAEANEEE